MKVTVRFLGLPQGALPQAALEVQVEAGTTVATLIRTLSEEHPVLRLYARFSSAVVNRAYVGMQTELHDGDDILYSPPVGGG